jgi:hypothetical protein
MIMVNRVMAAASRDTSSFLRGSLVQLRRPPGGDVRLPGPVLPVAVLGA